jgi:sugar lactone lactonase YvrE
MKTLLLTGAALVAAITCPPHGFTAVNYEPYRFITIAGKAMDFGSIDGPGKDARFYDTQGVVLDGKGNLYVSEWGGQEIRKLSPVGTNWVVTTLVGKANVAGSDDGIGSAARFNGMGTITMDASGSLYVADGGNHTIRKVAPVGADWMVTTIAGLAGVSGSNDGSGSTARFNNPMGITMDSAGVLYVTDSLNNTIRRMDLIGTNWVVSTIAGLAGESGSTDGAGDTARFFSPWSLSVDSAGSLYVAELENGLIRKVTPVGTKWMVTTLAGKATEMGSDDGIGGAARFNWPSHVALDRLGNLFVTDFGNSTIRKLTLTGTDWVVTTLAGVPGTQDHTDGIGSEALFNAPVCVTVDSAGNLYVSDSNNFTVRMGYPPPLAIQNWGNDFGFVAGQFGFALTGIKSGQTIVVEVSTNLTNWLPIWTNTTGVTKFQDPQSKNYSSRFYRAYSR